MVDLFLIKSHSFRRNRHSWHYDLLGKYGRQLQDCLGFLKRFPIKGASLKCLEERMKRCLSVCLS